MPGLRIIAGRWRGRALTAPAAAQTRPTSIRARQAVFDILLHAPWAGPAFIQSARVLDVFAGTGAYGLEALSRGARFASFIEWQPETLHVLRANIAACKAEQASRVIAADVLRPPPGTAHELVFLDPPYGLNLLSQALGILARKNYFAPAAVFVAEMGPEDRFEPPGLVAERHHGKARLLFWVQPHPAGDVLYQPAN